MQEISLRKAHQIQLELEKSIKGIVINTSCKIDEFHDVDETIATTRKDFYDNRTRKNLLLDTLYSVRDKVDNINNTSGINKALTTIAKLNRQIGVFEEILNDYRPAEKVEVLKARQAKVIELGKDANLSSRYIITSVLNDDDVEQVKENIARLKKHRAKLQDTVLEANIKYTISLVEDEITVLNKERLL